MPASGAAASPTPSPTPRLTLYTLTRGDGLLGLKPGGPFGARGVPLSVARVGMRDGAPAAVFVDPPSGSAAAQALDRLKAAGLHPVPPKALQWRARDAARGHPDLWSLPQEQHFADFCETELPALAAEGWHIEVLPGFAHEVEPVEGWRLEALGQPHGEGSWMLSLGIEVAGDALDLVPLLAELIRRDTRWLEAGFVATLDDRAQVLLRTPQGRRIRAEAAPLKAIVGTMLDLLLHPHSRRAGPLQVAALDAPRLDALAVLLETSQAARAGGAAWALQGRAGLAALVERLRGSGAPPPVPAPAGLGITLRPYQARGLAWLQYLRAQGLAGLLADDMGLGKTAQALAHLLVEKQAGRLDRPALVVVPTSLVFNWQAESARIAPALSLLVLHGPRRAEALARVGGHEVVLTTYPLLVRDLRALERQPWHLLVADEAQMVKNVATRAARALRRLDARHRLSLTGTPLQNHLGELWAQFDFLLPGFLGDLRTFRKLWREPIEKNAEVLRAKLLAERMRPFILRRLKAEVAPELPPKTEIVQRLRLEGRQRTLYESVRVAADRQVKRALERGGFDGTQIVVLDALLKLRQVCVDPALVLHEAGREGELPATMERAKLAHLRELLPALVGEGRRLLVFSQFARMLAILGRELDALGLPWLSLTGRTPAVSRGEVVRRFQAGETALLLASLKVGGVGLNLTAADTVIHLDPWWNPAVEDQATDRAHRIGQTQPVFVYRLLIEGSIEERVVALQARKAALAAGVLGHDAGGAVKFDEAELAGLLAPLG